MSRKRPRVNRGRHAEQAGVSLFPFLAVLICTMGSLILLLVLIARQAKVQAAEVNEEAAAKATEQETELQAARDVSRWRIEKLRESRQATETQLADARLHLGQIEDHIRRLSEQLVRLKATLADFNRAANDGLGERSKIEAEAAELAAEIDALRQQLAEARKEADQRRGSYAVIPYQGHHETHQRPIYIECTAEAVILQPEGIKLTIEDFTGPLGPGNPLAAALRAKRELLLTRGQIDPETNGEPYPLLLVRPDGTQAFYAARAAMDSWASEFGYELVDQDWKLAFEPRDEELTQVTRRAVELARVRQARLAASAPRHYGSSQSRATYRAAPYRGGIIRDGALPGEERSTGPFGRPSRTFGPAFGWGRREESGQTPGAGATHGTEQPEGTVAGRPPRELPEGAGPQPGPALRPGEWSPRSESGAGRQAADHAGATQHLRALAETRGQDWGLPDAAGGSVPITRPIRVRCHQDRLVVLPEKGTPGERIVALAPRTEHSIDEFISAIWEHMESWGIAGKGMYWRPVLELDVAPSGELRFDELKALLDQSGLSVERK